ncbi:phage tail tape measure protein [Salipiger bermudensis]|uniref:Phage-related tail protein n=1 Tax=Salipiger bermudensis (strain DSM 26914 / JCM 13377 / KCTC 12554 / HTCC2601) TaxID=314265 RepID=Q0FLM9_SALBH|nr:phage tail tape measure protein [Salipiger bermudensis]EAU45069.1 phage-related tail protein [Salipiger bermudensis HTCC2601]
MSNTARNYTIRLSAAGHRQLEQDLKSLGASGERSLRRIQGAARPASTGMRETDRAARELRGSLGAISAELPALQRVARFMGTTALAGGLVAFGRSALNAGREFQAMMQRVEAATKASEAEIAQLSAAAKDLGATTAFTATQSAQAIEVLAKNGLDVTTILGGALDSSISLAGALGSEVAPAADLVTDLMQQFGLEADKLPEIVDRVTGAAFTSKFGFDDLRLAIAQAGGVAGTTGVEIEEFLTVLSATASSFASGSDAGTSFKTFLQRLTPESAKAAGVMKDLDLQFFDAQGNMRTMAEIAQELQDGLAGLSEEARNEALKTVFGTDAIRTAAALAKQGAEGIRDLSSAIGEISAQEQAEVRLRGLDGALKELAAAWEALNLEAAENGGLDLAEEAVRRVTDALRYLTENFELVEEVVERVANALTVYLVGRGMTLVIAKAVAVRAALIEIAGAASGVGTAAGRAAAPMMRFGVAARALTGILGGPLSLAITAGSLIAFGLDTDVAADAVERAETAATRAASALDAYQEASRRAAEEQKGLGGQVSETTQNMLNQSRAALEQARADLERTYAEARGALSGSFWDGDGIDDFRGRIAGLAQLEGSDRSDLERVLWPEDAKNDFLARMAEASSAVESGKMAVADFVAEFDAIRAVGASLEPVRDRLIEILDSGDRLVGNDMVSELAGAAREAGLFADEIAALEAASSEAEMASAVDDLARALTEALEAGKVLRDEGLSGFRENITELAGVEEQLGLIHDQLSANHEMAEDLKADRPFDETGDSARAAAEEIERLSRVYGEYQAGRAAAPKPVDMRPWEQPRSQFDPTNMDPATVRALAVLEQASGKTFKISSDYRSPDENDAAGGAKKSQHMQGRAFDIDVSDMSIDERLELIKLARSVAGFGGVGVYSNSLHFDTGAERAWGPDYTSGSVPAWAAEAVGMYGRGSSAGTTTTDDLDAQAEALERVVAIGRDQLEQLRLEAELAGRTVEEQARLTFQYEAVKRAKEAGIDPETALADNGRRLIEVIDEQAAAYGRLMAAREQEEATAEGIARSTEQAAADVEAWKGQISGAFDNLKPGGAGVEAFWDDLTSMILDKLWSLALDPIWDQLAQLMDQAFSGFGGGISFGAAAGGAATGGYSASAGAMTSGGLYRNGGLMLPKRAEGGGFRDVPRAQGKLEGLGGKRQDNLLFWGSRGEFMQPADAVDHYGVEFMEAVRTMRLPKRADGGGFADAPSSAGGGRSSPASAPEITINNYGAKVSTRRTSGGGLDIDVEQAIDDYFDSGRGNRAMKRNYSLRATPKGK